jgi:hypothetical protein
MEERYCVVATLAGAAKPGIPALLLARRGGRVYVLFIIIINTTTEKGATFSLHFAAEQERRNDRGTSTSAPTTR